MGRGRGEIEWGAGAAGRGSLSVLGQTVRGESPGVSSAGTGREVSPRWHHATHPATEVTGSKIFWGSTVISTTFTRGRAVLRVE